jgi:hypothetical protein
MAASFVVTVNIPDSGTRAQELWWAAQGLEIAARSARSTGGQQTSGDVLADFAQNIGSWSYTPQAPS